MPQLSVEKVASVKNHVYLLGVDIFNTNPERGIAYLIGRGFVKNSYGAIAKFIKTEKGLSKKMVGEFLSNFDGGLSMNVLE